MQPALAWFQEEWLTLLILKTRLQRFVVLFFERCHADDLAWSWEYLLIIQHIVGPRAFHGRIWCARRMRHRLNGFAPAPSELIRAT